jgi:ribonuclease T
VSDTPEIPYHHQLKNRFRGYFPVIIDVETAGFDAKKDALLELAAITLKMDGNGNLHPDQKCHFHIEPFEGANINPESLKFNGIDIHNPLRGAVSELDAITGCSKWCVVDKKMLNVSVLLSWHTTRLLTKAS